MHVLFPGKVQVFGHSVMFTIHTIYFKMTEQNDRFYCYILKYHPFLYLQTIYYISIMKRSHFYGYMLICFFVLGIIGCTGKKTQSNSIDFAGGYSETEIANAKKVINYYENSMKLLKAMVPEKGINAMVEYIDKDGKGMEMPETELPPLTQQDIVELVNGVNTLDEETRESLKFNYSHLFQTVVSFHINFDDFVDNMNNLTTEHKWHLSNSANQMAMEISEYKQQIYDDLEPAIENAFYILLENSSSRRQVILMHKMDLDMLSVLNMYARKKLADGRRIDERLDKLSMELTEAKDLPEITDQPETEELFRQYLQSVEAFLNQSRIVRRDELFSEDSYDMLSSAYATAII